jgi:hypothetical protein
MGRLPAKALVSVSYRHSWREAESLEFSQQALA